LREAIGSTIVEAVESIVVSIKIRRSKSTHM
jgi:hypothetical protein